MFQLDTALNLIWALFCVGALVYHIRSERRREGAGTHRARAIRALALFLAVVSLFPCVSATDDSVRFEYLGSTHSAPANHPNESKQGPGNAWATLVRLLESLESVQVPLIVVLSVSLCFFSLVAVEWFQGQDRLIPQRSGRAPPSVSLPA
ncbi:MAG TPA: hypothetical protein VGV35_08650 [Bryobacteraceae bacterium]|nr:hypothetical protein [Bryobacteraceae bacterium]